MFGAGIVQGHAFFVIVHHVAHLPSSIQTSKAELDIKIGNRLYFSVLFRTDFHYMTQWRWAIQLRRLDFHERSLLLVKEYLPIPGTVSAMQLFCKVGLAR